MLSQHFVQDFGMAVRQLREVRNWSQEQLAGHSDLNRSYLGEIERGQVSPSLITLHKLAQAFQMSATELIVQTERISLLRESQRLRLGAIAG